MPVAEREAPHDFPASRKYRSGLDEIAVSRRGETKTLA